MESQFEDMLNPERFAQVWERVTEGTESLVEAAVSVKQAVEEALDKAETTEWLSEALEEYGDTFGDAEALGRECEYFLQRQYRLELCRAVQFRHLGTQRDFQRLAKAAEQRARQLRTELFLRTGGFCEEMPEPVEVIHLPTALRELYHSSVEMEQRYRQAAELMVCPELRCFFSQLACEMKMEQSRIRALLNHI